MDLTDCYLKVRKRTEMICSHLQTEDYVVQPVADVSPPKWHIGHTTWFFEAFILKPYFMGYQEYNADYNFVFNSYYETVGNRVIRTDRGNLSRPTVNELIRYREYVDEAMANFLCHEPSTEVRELIILGLNHEEQHQELLYTDIKYILGHNPLFPAYDKNYVSPKVEITGDTFIKLNEGVYEIGFNGDGFCFDNELGRHKVYLNSFEISPDVYGIKAKTAGFLEDDKIYSADVYGIKNKVVGFLQDSKIYSADVYGIKNKLTGFYEDGKIYRADQYGIKDKLVGFLEDGKIYSADTYGIKNKVSGFFDGNEDAGIACAAVILILH